MVIKAIIVDDEPLAHNIIIQYSNQIEGIQIVHSCETAMEALSVLNNEQVDLIFLDINMPKLSGISFLKSLKNPPLVIFTTAYSEYAMEGYELDVIDYLKKPFSFERFLKAYQKAHELIHLKKQADTPSSVKDSEGYIFIKANKKSYKLNFSDILFVEGLGDYIKIHLPEKSIVTNMTMKKIQEDLPITNFIRIHKSFIISFNHIKEIEGNMVLIQKTKIPIGNNYRHDFFDMINQKTNS